ALASTDNSEQTRVPQQETSHRTARLQSIATRRATKPASGPGLRPKSNPFAEIPCPHLRQTQQQSALPSKDNSEQITAPQRETSHRTARLQSIATRRATKSTTKPFARSNL